MPIKSCTIDGKNIKTIDDVYDQLALQLEFPNHFGRNLDALYDVLTTDIPGPLKIVWHHTRASRAVLGDQYNLIKAVLKDAAAERKDIRVVFK